MAQFGSALACSRLSVVILLGVLGNAPPAAAAIDMSGKYEAIEFPCHYTFVQTGTALGLSGTCGPQSQPMSGTGTIDSSTGAFTLSGNLTGVCNTLVITGTADGEMFTATDDLRREYGPCHRERNASTG